MIINFNIRKQRVDMIEISLVTKRNLFHLALGILVLAGIYLYVIDVWGILAIVIVGILLSMASRFRPVPFISWFLRRFERDEDISGGIPGRGALFFFVGLLIVAALFERDIVLASVTIFVIADSVSPLVGIRIGRIRHPLSEKKFLEGSIAGFIFAFIGAMLFVAPVEAFVATFLGVIVEAIDTVKGKRIEDNITIPLVAGLVITLLRLL